MKAFVLLIALAVCGFAQVEKTPTAECLRQRMDLAARHIVGFSPACHEGSPKKSTAKRRKPVAKKRAAVKTEISPSFGSGILGAMDSGGILTSRSYVFNDGNASILMTDGAGAGLSTRTYTPDTCTVFVLLSALEEANREFVTDPNESDHAQWSTWSNAIGTLTWTHPDYRTQADKLRADAEIKAKELERKSDVVKRIRAAIAACKGVPDTVLRRSSSGTNTTTGTTVIDLRKPE